MAAAAGRVAPTGTIIGSGSIAVTYVDSGTLNA